MIGAYGENITFLTSDDRILNFDGFTRNTAARWEKHEVINSMPVNEYIGPDLDTVTFSIDLNWTFGVDPRTEMNKWLVMCRSGESAILTLGEVPMGTQEWIVKSCSQMYNRITNKGKVLKGKLDITLEEYVGGF